jgi:hypothetical protein
VAARPELLTEVWAKLLLSRGDSHRVRAFFIAECGIKSHHVVSNMHLTVYYARRPMPGVLPLTEPARVVVPANETRFMVMAPGGENPRPNLEPSRSKIGIRVHRRSSAIPAILEYRQRLLTQETPTVLGRRPPSGRWKNAFGARHFQPHVTLLRRGSGIDGDLTILGRLFRNHLKNLVFDRFVVDITAEPGRTRS